MKNKMMRLASLLMVAVLLTTSVVSGTYAKYVTTAEGTDTARVAKWGVVVKAQGNLFERSYIHAPDTTDNATVIRTEGTEDVVAPGTKNTGVFTFSVEGTPEVANTVTIDVTEWKDVVLPAATYLDFTTGNNEEDTFVLGTTYYPIQYKLTHTPTVGDATTTTYTTMEDLVKALEAIGTTGGSATINKPNVDLGTVYGTYTISWEWVFGDSANNQADTFLGSVAANKVGLPENASITAKLAMNITVAQED